MITGGAPEVVLLADTEARRRKALAATANEGARAAGEGVVQELHAFSIFSLYLPCFCQRDPRGVSFCVSTMSSAT
jgi:hypothetical protein